MKNTGTTIKFTDPQRILRIFRKLSESRLPVFMRPSLNSTLAIRGLAGEISRHSVTTSDIPWQLVVTGISDKGVSLLREKNGIILEFVLTSSKLICTCPIREVKRDQIAITLPKTLVSLERRSSARYKTLTRSMAYVSLSCFTPDEKDFLSPPAFSHHMQIANYLAVNDLSLGGLSIKTCFPGASRFIKKDTVDLDARLHLPLQKPLCVPLKFLWVKKISQSEEVKQGKVAIQKMWLFGSVFLSLGEEQKTNIKKFIQKTNEIQADESLNATEDPPKAGSLLTSGT